MISLRNSINAIFGAICLLALAVGCATVPTTDSTANADARKFQPGAGMASIYLCRHAAGFGDMLVAQTQLDGLMIGALAPNTYLLVSVAPGQHTLGVVGPTNAEQVTVDAAAGSVYFFDVSISWAGPGIRHRHIKAISDSDGESQVNSETRAEGTTTNPDSSGM
jgi:Protein of unknown function (DUF2846)